MLRERRVFAPCFIPQRDADVYDPLFYRREALQHDTTTILLADRNVVTRWLALLSDRTSIAAGSFSCCNHGVRSVGQRTR
ncbi:MAG TPA: hypothetical protein VFY67_03610 [Pyrinomonadaceae bacterium]|nr:hypothetical protein [Pyrinomonadaceae bacterium]